MNREQALSVGVVGVGTMGEHHARVLSELPTANLVGVTDSDDHRARSVARTYDCVPMSLGGLLDRVEAVSVAVPTRHHFAIASECIEQGVDVLVEKPFVSSPDEGRELIRRANARDVVLQVGHVERFNPAVQALFEFVDAEEIVAMDASRLGPPREREVQDDVMSDLMIHDIDILLALLDADPDTVSGLTGCDGQYASVLMQFDDVVATATASRVTQRKVRTLEVTTSDRLYVLDYIDQTIRIHRRSKPTYTNTESDVRYRHESLIERPMIEATEPLRLEVEAFLDAVANRSTPPVTGRDGLAALEVIWRLTAPEADHRVEVRSG